KYLQLIFSDNGIGQKADSSLKGTGFGSQLIDLLTQQLNGTMQKEIINGTHYRFELKKAF
ncbi:MAG: hypothetical protein AAFP82_13310, partial [Bacteroidota bacterium]